MKNLVKILFAAIVTVAFGNGALAQATSSVPSSATVVSEISFTAVHDLAFGNVSFNAGPKTVLVADANAGGIKITKAASSQLTITLSYPPWLTTGDGDTDITKLLFSAPKYATNHVSGNGSLSSGSAYSTAFTTTGTDYNSAADIYLYLGGTLTAITGQTQGSYTGIVGVSVTYN